MQAHTLSQKEEGVSKHLKLTHLISPCIFELQNGQIGSTLQVEGVCFDTNDSAALNACRRSLHHAVCTLGDEFSIYTHTIRRKLQVNLSGHFDNEFCRHLDKKYHEKFNQKNLYTNELYITLLYKGFHSGKFGKGLGLMQKLSHKAIKAARAQARIQAVGRLNKAVDQFKAIIVKFKPRRLGDADVSCGYSELLRFYGQFVNALVPMQYPYTDFATPLGQGVDAAKKVLALYPQGNLSHYLPTKRLFMGDYIEFKSTHNESSFGAMVSVKSYGNDTYAIMLNKLLHLDCEFAYTNSFSIEADTVAQKKIRRHLVKMQNAEDAATSQMLQLTHCQDDIASERLKVGHHHNTLMLVADNIDDLQTQVNQVIKIYSDCAMVAIQETLGLEPAFWAQMPGNQQYIFRSSLITSQNFVDFCPQHNYKTGYIHQNHLGSALTLIETPSKTPMFFNFHSKGNGKKNDKSPGHTTIIGGNFSGKTVFMGFMDAQMHRYGGRSFFIDKDRGLEIYIRAAGGLYSIISPDYPADVNFNPFWLEDTPSNRSFLIQWMAQLIIKPEERHVPAAILKWLSDCVNYAYDSLQQSHRNLTNVARLLPIDFPRWDELNQWLTSDGIRNDGAYAYLFDNPEDTLNLNAACMGFDFTELMKQPQNVVTAVSMYLLQRIGNSLDGQRVSVNFDEGWQLLCNPYWVDKLKDLLATYRKKNAHINLATQSPQTIVASPISHLFFDNCATNIFFCNDKADYEKHYQYFGVTPSEFDFIKNTPTEKRLFLYKQGGDSAICKLNLAHMSKEMAVLSANEGTTQLLETIRKSVGDNPKHFLPVFYERLAQLEAEQTL